MIPFEEILPVHMLRWKESIGRRDWEGEYEKEEGE